MQSNYTLSILSENSPGILHRISTIFTRRGINIESLTVSETERKGISRYTIVIKADKALAEKVTKQMQRIIEVSEVFLCENKDLIYKEIAFIKVACVGDHQVRLKIEDLAQRYHASVLAAGDHFLVIEKSGREEEIDSLFLLLEPFGILEFIRSGRIALLKEQERAAEKVVAEEETIDVSKIGV